MNPELPRPQGPSEMLPPIPGAVEYQPGVVEVYGEGRPVAPATTPIVPVAAAAPQPPIVSTAPSAPAPAAIVATAPAIAGDDDLIEKEWVDKLKKIITLTAGDPYERTRVIAQLQADYLKKRYNKTLGEDRE